MTPIGSRGGIQPPRGFAPLHRPFLSFCSAALARMLLHRSTKESHPGYELGHTFAQPFSLALARELLSADNHNEACT
jgi:hypothetical protein